VSSVTRKVTHLVAGADPGAKLARAEGYDIDIMDEAAFLSLLQEHGVEPDA
jgi:DNA ligase (NAD+)